MTATMPIETDFVHSPPLPQHLHIVALETYLTTLPPIVVPKPYTFTLTAYERSAGKEIAERIADADIVISMVVPLRSEALAAAPRLRLISVMASGTDSVDLDFCAARGIRVLNSPNCNTTSLSEHVAAMYLSLRRGLLPVMRATARDDWPREGTLMSHVYTCGVPPPSCRDETLAIVGYGGVGQAVCQLLGGLGMQVVVAARKGGDPAPESTSTSATSASSSPPRIAFDEALQRATVLVVCCPRLPDTMKLIGSSELARMRPDAILINVSRGGIVCEADLVSALREGRLSGAGVDVFDHEPASSQSSPLVAAAAAADLNLIITPHTAWVAASTRENYRRTAQENVERFLRGTYDADRVRA
ncbi:glycerate dehydrogenase [Grosmannia clavigera kw1407]|uniref:Glycerate dehydrogenase n=1 Tax=Grosmannia clavigera (strain kw1407 / UAMH 11150) TaxID=655863 RepID=F0X902_GROCL|nr:glycerate dehydrogenase [Grosmannia clavigera kw1407]EFX06149.1 glycerate dehydrogenase [Grosmannia clavigera kw1407]